MPHPLILFVAANPRGTDPVALDRECRDIEIELQLTPGRDDFQLRSKWAVTVDELMRHLNGLSPVIVHFGGHGTADGICLEAEDETAQTVPPRALAAMIRSAGPQVRAVVLNACYSHLQAEAICGVVDCVIGMEGPVEDTAAHAFAVGFYRALGHRRSIGAAFAQAEATLEAKGLLGSSAGALPRLSARAGVDAAAVYPAGHGEARPATIPSSSPAAGRSRGVVRLEANMVLDFVERAGDQLTMVFFCTATSTPCHAMLPLLERLVRDHHPELRIARVEIDPVANGPQPFAIDIVPTILVYRGNALVQRIIGRTTLEKLLAAVERA
jgi:hypothetical protein